METFLVRLWVPSAPENAGAQPLRGIVEEVRTGSRRPFVGADELLAALEGEGADVEAHAGTRSSANRPNGLLPRAVPPASDASSASRGVRPGLELMDGG
jgi:hypothetical protein